MPRMNQLGRTATRIVGEDGGTAVYYHNTRVVFFDAARIILYNGGFWTVTTKTRMNQTANQFELGFHVRQEKGHWIVEFHHGRTYRENFPANGRIDLKRDLSGKARPSDWDPNEPMG